MTRDLINNITKRNLTGGQTPCEAGLHFLRFAAILLLLLVVGVEDAWAATKDFDLPNGYYYLGNEANNNSVPKYNGSDFVANFYMCPASGSVNVNNYLGGDKNKPLITTYKSFSNNTKTYSWAVWYIEATTVDNADYFYIRHRDTGQYLVANDNDTPTATRRRVNLDSTTKPDGSDGLFKIQSDDNGVTYYISPKEKHFVNSDGDNKYLSPSNGNKDNLSATSNNSNTGGILGLWHENNKNSAWHFVQVPCDTPVITYNNTNNEVTITGMEGASFYYTTNGTVPDPSDIGGDKPTKVYDANSKPTVTASTMIKAIATKTEYANSEIAIQTIVLNPTIVYKGEFSYVYDKTAKEPIASLTYNSETIPETAYTIEYGNNTNVGAATGAATVSITDSGADDGLIVYGSTTFNITPKEASLAWEGTELQYNKTAQKPTATVSNLIAGDECTVTVTVPEGDGINIGEYTATATALSNTNYALPAVTTQTFNIVKKEVTISGITASNKVYDKTTSATLDYSGVTFGGLLEGDALTVTATGVFEDANAGTGKTVNISALTLGGTSIDNYKLAETGQQTTTTADITKKDVTVANGITANNKVYDGTATATFVCSAAVVEGVLEGDELTVTAATGTFNNKNVATGKTVTITNFTLGGTSAGNYKVAATGNQSYSTANITQLEAVLAWGNATLPYNATPQVPIVTVTNAVEGDDVTVTVTGAQTNVGENYEATASALSDANYILPTEGLTRTFSIAPATLTITADAKSKTYGDADPALTYTSSGLLGGDAVTGALTRNEGESAGTYAITQGTLTAGGNYTISYTGANLTINSKTLTITAEAKSKTYGEADPELTYTSEGLINDDAITGSLTREAGENAGDYAILQGDLTAGNNYAIAYTGANLTITKVGLTITANNNTITYGDAPAGNGITCEGFVNSETASVLSGTVGYDFSYKKFDNVGNAYSITPKGLTSSNYDITFVAGTLTVNAKEVGIDWANIAFDYDGEEHSPTATATGMVNGDLIGITVTGAQTNAGNHTATASALTGDKAGNYVLPEANTQSFTISSKSIGNGTNPADGISFDFGEGNTILLTDNTIGSTLVAPTDYTVGDDTSNSDKYSQRTVTGAGNYSGSFNVRNAKVSLTTDASEEGWSATFAAEKSDESDIGHALPEGVQAFIITGIKGEWAIPEQLDYIPEGVPVLLVASKKLNGFVPKAAESGKVTLVTDTQKGSNMLEEVTESTPNYNAGTQSAPFATKQIYLLYNNEFVFNKAGNLKKGKVYLNPNHTVPASPSPAPARLQIAWHQTTGIKDGKWIMEDGRSEHWYTLDGRRLNGKPSTKGLYIVNGKKIVVK